MLFINSISSLYCPSIDVYLTRYPITYPIVQSKSEYFTNHMASHADDSPNPSHDSSEGDQLSRCVLKRFVSTLSMGEILTS